MLFALLWLLGGVLLAGALASGDYSRALTVTTDRHGEERRRRLMEVLALFEHFPHYNDPTFIANYAQLQRETLMQERDQILQSHREFMRDTEFVTLLRSQSPDIYERACWKLKALAIAEQLTVIPTANSVRLPPTPPPKSAPVPAVIDITPAAAPPTRPVEGRETFAQRAMRLIRQQAEVERARLKATLDARDKVQAMLRKRGLPEDEIEQLVATFMEDLASRSSPDGKHGNTTLEGGNGDIIIR